jgi:hypothetical protein
VNECDATADLDAIVRLRMDGKDSINDAFGVKLLVAVWACKTSDLASCGGHVRLVSWLVATNVKSSNSSLHLIQLKHVSINRNFYVLYIFVGLVYYVEMDVFTDMLTCSTANVLSNPSGA